MTAAELLTTLEDKGVTLWEDEGSLRYSSPKGVITRELLGELAACKQEMLAMLQTRDSFTAICMPEEAHTPFPLTDLQSAYLIGRGDGFDLGNIACHVYLEFEKENLDAQLLAKNWNHLIRRHGMLRAIMRTDGTQQVLEEVPEYQISVENIVSENIEEQEKALKSTRDVMSHQVFKTDVWPLFELKISMLPEDKSRLHISMDQLIADGYSLEILFRELTLLEQEPDTELPSLALSFRDYVLAEEQFEATREYKKAKEYWLEKAETMPAAPALPLACAPENIEVPRFSCRSFTLAKDGWTKLKARAAKAGITPTATVLAVYSLVLGRWSKTPDFTVNMTAFNRLQLHPEVMNVVGEFTAVNLVSITQGDAGTFEEHARNVQQTLWETMDNRAYNGIQVMRELARKRGQSGEASMPVVFTSTIGVGPSGEEDFDLGRFGRVAYHISQTPQVWLDNQIVEVEGALICNWDSLEELFPQGVLDAMFTALGDMLNALAENDDAWSSAVTLTLPEESIDALEDITPALSGETLDSLFRASVQAYPNNWAVITPDKKLTYEELARYADSISILLADRVQHNTPVAVILPKGWEQASATLGIMQAGGAYLPVPVDAPQDRIQMLLKDSKCELALTTSAVAEFVECPEGVEFICVDQLVPQTTVREFSTFSSHPEKLAYIIHTSGSTGKPKGVATTHQAAVNTLLTINKKFDVTPQDRVFGLSALNFDLSVYDLFGAFAAGAAVVIPKDGDIRDTSFWIQAMSAERVTIWNSVPALMQMMLEAPLSEGQEDPMQSLRLVMMSGDWVPLDLPDAIRKRAPKAQPVSLGGATEAAIWSVFYPISEVDASWKSIPYGTALENQSLHVLNARLEPCPTWVPGELYIGGAGLAQEYWGDEERTAQSFIIHPETGKRLYRTGDWARLLPDGNFEFLGREDSQVKIRGHRIELGEIESVLKEHESVTDAVVTVMRETGGSDKLAAHVVPSYEGEAFEQLAPRLNWRSILQAGREKAQRMPETASDIPTFLRFCDTLDGLSIAHMCRTLRTFGTFGQPETLTLDEVMERGRVIPVHRRLLRRWLMALSREGLLTDNGKDRFTADEALPLYPVDSLWKDLHETSKGMGETEVLIRFMERSYDNLVPLFRGENEPQKILFPGGDMEVAESVYQTNPMSAYYHTILEGLVHAASTLATPENPLRVMEVGAGVGSSSSVVLPALPRSSSRYHFTDISTFFLKAAQEKFAQYPFMSYGLFDINTPLEKQGYVPHSYDVIIANNVLHNAVHVGETLQNLRQLLDEGGCLFILDQTGDYLPLMTTLEFLIDFGEYEDERTVTQTPFLSSDQWLTSLKKAGFGHNRAYPSPGHPCGAVGQHCLIGQSTTPVQGPRPYVLQDYLKTKLPDYMVPSRMRFIDSIPLTPTGKVNRKELTSSVTVEQLAPATSFVPPVTAEEKAFASLWEELLEVERVSLTDNFFELGGDSLQLTKLLSRMRELFGDGVDWEAISFRHLFEAPTVQGMLETLRNSGMPQAQIPQAVAKELLSFGKDNRTLIQLKASGSSTPLFLACDARNTTYIYRNIALQQDLDRPVYALRLPPHANPDQLGIEGVAAAHIAEMRKVQPTGPYQLGGFCMGGIVAYEMAQQLLEAGEEVAMVSLISSTRSHFLINDDTLICFMLCTELEIPLTDIGLQIEPKVLSEVSDALHGWYYEGQMGGDWKDNLTEERHGAFLEPYNKLAAMSQRERLGLIHSIANDQNHPFLENLTLDDFEDMFRIYKAGVAAVSKYRPQPYSNPILVLKPRDINPVIAQLVDSAELWKSVGQKSMNVVEVDGGHESCLEMPHVHSLASMLEVKLNEATNATLTAE